MAFIEESKSGENQGIKELDTETRSSTRVARDTAVDFGVLQALFSAFATFLKFFLPDNIFVKLLG